MINTRRLHEVVKVSDQSYCDGYTKARDQSYCDGYSVSQPERLLTPGVFGFWPGEFQSSLLYSTYGVVGDLVCFTLLVHAILLLTLLLSKIPMHFLPETNTPAQTISVQLICLSWEFWQLFFYCWEVTNQPGNQQTNQPTNQPTQISLPSPPSIKMSAEIFAFAGQKLVQKQSNKVKDELVKANKPTSCKPQSDTVGEVFLGIGNHMSLVSTQTLIHKFWSICASSGSHYH